MKYVAVSYFTNVVKMHSPQLISHNDIQLLCNVSTRKYSDCGLENMVHYVWQKDGTELYDDVKYNGLSSQILHISVSVYLIVESHIWLYCLLVTLSLSWQKVYANYVSQV